MARRNILLATAIAIAVIIGLAPLLLGRLILHAHADRFGREEMSAIAVRQLERAEVVLAEAISVLREADRAGLAGCRPNDLALLGEKAAHSQYLRRIGVVDAGGLPRGFDPPPASRRAGALFAPDPSRPVTIALLDPEATPDVVKGTVVVGWRAQNGVHLVAEVSPSMLDLDGGAEYLRGARSVVVEVGTETWATSGVRAGLDEDVVIELRSDYFPLRVRVATSRVA